MKISFKKFIPGIAWFFIVLVLICLPGKEIPKVGWLININFDKAVHVGVFGLLTILFCRPFYKSSFNKKEVTLDLAKSVVEKFVKNVKREISIDYIQKVVSDYFQLDLDTLQSKTRKRHVVQARQLAMFFAKKFTKSSLANIGSQIGDRDHATVLHACKTVDNLVSTDKQFKKFVEDIHKKLSL